ncbi:MAG: hypothetical protein ACYDH5_15605, partial [Acidimicrobiales bacterium]
MRTNGNDQGGGPIGGAAGGSPDDMVDGTVDGSAEVVDGEDTTRGRGGSVRIIGSKKASSPRARRHAANGRARARRQQERPEPPDEGSGDVPEDETAGGLAVTEPSLGEPSPGEPSPGEPDIDDQAMLHWSDPPTGEVPAVLLGGRSATDAGLLPRGGARWREQKSDWAETEYDDPLFAADEGSPGPALSEDGGDGLEDWPADDWRPPSSNGTIASPVPGGSAVRVSEGPAVQVTAEHEPGWAADAGPVDAGPVDAGAADAGAGDAGAMEPLP